MSLFLEWSLIYPPSQCSSDGKGGSVTNTVKTTGVNQDYPRQTGMENHLTYFSPYQTGSSSEIWWLLLVTPDSFTQHILWAMFILLTFQAYCTTIWTILLNVSSWETTHLFQWCCNCSKYFFVISFDITFWTINGFLRKSIWARLVNLFIPLSSLHVEWLNKYSLNSVKWN